MMGDRLPLSALLSHALVAFTIEFDNAFEHRVPHRTTNHGATGDPRSSPWLVSMMMWLYFLRFVPDEGISTKELYRLIGVPKEAFRAWLVRLCRWRYLTVSDHFVRPIPGGLKALQAWRPLTGEIEKRWRDRFGGSAIDRLQAAMQVLAGRFAPAYPGYLPILGFPLTTEPAGVPAAAENSLPALYAKLLIAFAMEFERESELSLAICANLLRITGEEGVRVRDLPQLSGVSKEAIAMALGRAEGYGLGRVRDESPASRVKSFVLTAKGRSARDHYRRIVRKIEAKWKREAGDKAVDELRESLERLIADPRFPEGIKPYAGNWRAAVRQPQTLPHHPMVLHRGGFPDGS